MASAMAPRFGGQALKFQSVAQHAVNTSILVGHLGRPDLDLEALHHDSHEAYACDLPRPLKLVLGHPYKDVTARLDEAIAEAFGFEPLEADSPEYEVIKTADDALFVIEAADLLEGRPNRASGRSGCSEGGPDGGGDRRPLEPRARPGELPQHPRAVPSPSGSRLPAVTPVTPARPLAAPRTERVSR